MANFNEQLGNSHCIPLLKFQISYQNPHKSPLIVSFIHWTKTIKATNLITLQTDLIKINSPDNLSPWNCIHQLPNNELFCAINPDCFCLVGTALIIDKKFNVKTLSHNIPVWSGRVSYLNGWIYMFSAFCEFSCAIKYNLARRKWVKIPSPPIGSTYVESMEFCGLILCSSTNGELICYDPFLNSYCSVLKPKVWGDSVLACHEGIAYLIYLRRRIFVCKWKNPFCWDEISARFCIEYNLISGNTYWEDSFYFSTKNQVYEFNLKTKKLSCKIDASEELC